MVVCFVFWVYFGEFRCECGGSFVPVFDGLPPVWVYESVTVVRAAGVGGGFAVDF